MLEMYRKLALDLFAYQEFWGVLQLLQAALWLGLLVIVLTVVLHVLYLLGFQTLLYRKRRPRAHWNRPFFTGALSVSLLILIVLTGVEWVDTNMVVDHKRQSVIHLLSI